MVGKTQCKMRTSFWLCPASLINTLLAKLYPRLLSHLCSMFLDMDHRYAVMWRFVFRLKRALSGIRVNNESHLDVVVL
jgi:hypothetical protein